MLDENEMMMEEEEEKVLSLWNTPIHFRMTRRGKIVKNVSERYLRQDLEFGFRISTLKEKKRNDAVITTYGPAVKIDSLQSLLVFLQEKEPLLVCDTNVLLHNLDVLERLPTCNIVIPQTALLECRHVSLTTYNRVMELIRSSSQIPTKSVLFFPNVFHTETQQSSSETTFSSINDENDAKIRRVADFFGQALIDHHLHVILLTDDVANRDLAQQEQRQHYNTTSTQQRPFYLAKSVRQHVQQLIANNPSTDPHLLDLVAHFSSSSSSDRNNPNNKNQVSYYAPHLSSTDLTMGIKSGAYFQGYIRAERGGHNSCYVTVRKGDDRVGISIIGKDDINRAVDGDVVAVQLHTVDKWITRDILLPTTTAKDSSTPTTGIAADTAEPSNAEQDNVTDTLDGIQKPTGKVVGIIRRNFRQNYCGSIHSSSGNNSERDAIVEQYEEEHADGSFTVVFFAVDNRIPPIFLRTTQREKLLGRRILVAMDAWPAHSPYPLGHYVQTIGTIGTKDVETQVLLHEHNIPCDPFPAKVLACLPPEDYKIELEPGRLDLRHLPVLSIDPPGCKDIDDALHCIVLPNGNYQVGVHIADVTHYVKAGTAIDLEAANRSTSTYLVNKRLDMLPSLLTTDLCSLKGNVDRFAFSVLWEVSPTNADIIHVEFKKSIIHSIAALTYQQAQTFIDDETNNKVKNTDTEYNIKAGAVQRLAKLARIFRAKRIAAGALTLASPEVKFVLDAESLNPTDVTAYPLYEANALVEEFMLLANVTVSKKILRHYPTLSVLRRHPAPNRAMFDSLISKARCRGFQINIDDSKKLADSLDQATIPKDPYFNKLLRILSTRCMSPAQYFCSGEFKPMEWHHYGLAAPVYTHFTSPIRRYADVCVHRLLAAAIGVEPLPVHLSSKSHLHDLAANMNRRHRSAQLAGRASVQLHTLLFFSGDAGEKEEDAYVLDVDTTENSVPSFTVIVPKYGIEGRVTLTHIPSDDPNLLRRPKEHKIVYQHGNNSNSSSVQVFEKVRVKIWVRYVQDGQRELVLDLISPNFHPPQESNDDSDDETDSTPQKVNDKTKKKRRDNQRSTTKSRTKPKK